MTPQQPLQIIFAPEVVHHLRVIDRKYHSLIRNTIEEQLSYDPEVETRNRKPLKRPIELGATWELRLGSSNEFRVFYRTELSENQVTAVPALMRYSSNWQIDLLQALQQYLVYLITAGTAVTFWLLV